MDRTEDGTWCLLRSKNKNESYTTRTSCEKCYLVLFLTNNTTDAMFPFYLTAHFYFLFDLSIWQYRVK